MPVCDSSFLFLRFDSLGDDRIRGLVEQRLRFAISVGPDNVTVQPIQAFTSQRNKK